MPGHGQQASAQPWHSPMSLALLEKLHDELSRALRSSDGFFV